LLGDAVAGRLGALTFLDLRADIVERELARLRAGQRSGPHAENMLKDIGIVASGAV
jgi:pyruvate ferredoxin oxidoreductase alpha subunit